MAFLDVEQSAKGFVWTQRPVDADAAASLSRRPDINPVARHLLAARGVDDDGLDNFLNPRLRHLLPEPTRLKGFEEFETAFFAAVKAGERIGILADYDVDGATSAAVLVALLRALGLEFELYVPDRLTEGYGPSDQAFEHFVRTGIRTVVCLDCGSMAHGPVQRAQRAGHQVLIIDHHQIDGAPPEVSAHINPNQAGCESGIETCAAVGVCFAVVVGLRRGALNRGLGCEIDLMKLLDLVALGTVCDVVPLRGLNRAYVLQGLKVWPHSSNPGQQALLKLLPKTPTFDGTLAGFQIGPRLNAAGRIGPSHMAAKLLTSADEAEAATLAAELDRLNKRRREIEANVLAQARLQLQVQVEEAGSEPAINLVADPRWHPGVVGIVAGRLKDSTGKPSIVLGGVEGDDALTGSGRSVPGFDLGATVLDLRARGVLISGGGHAMAAGLKLLPADIETVRENLSDAFIQTPQGQVGIRERQVDLAIRPGAATVDLARFLAQLQPFGSENPEPKIVVQDVRVEFMALAGKNHLRMTLVDGAGDKVKGIAFRAAGTALETVLRQGRDRNLHLAGSLVVDEWAGGNAAQLLVDDAALAS